MAIAFDASTLLGYSGSGSKTTSHTCSGTNRLLVVEAFTGSASSTCAYAGTSMTAVGTPETNGDGYYHHMWYLVNPASGANDVVLSTGGSYLNGAIASYTGVKQTDQPDSTGSANGGVQVLTITMSVTGDNCWLIGSGSYRDASIVAGANTYIRYNGGWHCIADSNGTVASGSRSIVIDSGSGSWTASEGGLALAILPAITTIASTLTATQQSYALTGQAGTLRIAMKVIPTYASFALTGIATLLGLGQRMTATFASFVLTGQDILYRFGKAISAEFGSFTLTGQDAGFKKTLSFIADVGSFVLTGIAATLTAAIKYTWTLTASTGSFILTGISALLKVRGWLMETLHTNTWSAESKHSDTWEIEDKN